MGHLQNNQSLVNFSEANPSQLRFLPSARQPWLKRHGRGGRLQFRPMPQRRRRSSFRSYRLARTPTPWESPGWSKSIPLVGPGFGFQHFKSYDFLRDHEVVLTFDDGPWPVHTPAVLKALADQCVRATFFPIGKHATYHPEILKQVIAAGHTVGSHTWSHADLVAVLAKLGPAAAKEEIEKGASAVHLMAGAPIAPFFRFPDLRHPPEMVSYLGDRNVAIFSTDIDSFDFRIKNPDQLIKSVMGKLTKMGKGIILVHDFQRGTSIALPRLLEQMQMNSFKIVHMVPKSMLTTLPQYDEAVLKQNVLQTATNRPTDSVVKTISE
jgi:peptidoglycan/xylan/chitin deacetylase (PgdA/CDA1 family)